MIFRYFRRPVALALAAGATVAGVAVAQPQTRPVPIEPEAIIYRDANFSGPAVSLQPEERNLGLAWRVSSIRVRQGQWQLCSEVNYRGTCVTVDRDRNRLGLLGRGMTVQSARYVGGGWQQPQPGDGGQSLRGMSSQYYSLPMLYGQEVLACRTSATANCAAQTADNFCTTMGWRQSVHERMETRSGRVVLRDVLCSNAAY